MKNKIRVAIIGLGGIAHLGHLEAFGKLAECEVVAGCDIDERKFPLATAKLPALEKFYTDAGELLKKEKPDAVVIGTPNDTHAPLSIAALEAGAAVLCEKPLARNFAEADTIRKAMKKTKGKLMVGLCFRFRNQTPILRELVANKLGKVYYCKGSYLRARGIPGWGTWFTDRERAGGGVILDLGVHLLDYFWYLLGKPDFRSVSCVMDDGIGQRKLRGEQAGFGKTDYPSTYMGPEQERFDVEEMGSLLVRFADGAALQLEVAWAMNIDPIRSPSGGMIFGDRGAVSISPVVHTYDRGGEMVSEEIPVEQTSSHCNQAREFIAFVRGERDNPAPVEDALPVMRVLDAAYQSAREGCEISL
jgi:predicted dehydrogenase